MYYAPYAPSSSVDAVAHRSKLMYEGVDLVWHMFSNRTKNKMYETEFRQAMSSLNIPLTHEEINEIYTKTDATTKREVMIQQKKTVEIYMTEAQFNKFVNYYREKNQQPQQAVGINKKRYKKTKKQGRKQRRQKQTRHKKSAKKPS
jgi:hypothetical protein